MYKPEVKEEIVYEDNRKMLCFDVIEGKSCEGGNFYTLVHASYRPDFGQIIGPRLARGEACQVRDSDIEPWHDAEFLCYSFLIIGRWVAKVVRQSRVTDQVYDQVRRVPKEPEMLEASASAAIDYRFTCPYCGAKNTLETYNTEPTMNWICHNKGCGKQVKLTLTIPS